MSASTRWGDFVRWALLITTAIVLIALPASLAAQAEPAPYPAARSVDGLLGIEKRPPPVPGVPVRQVLVSLKEHRLYVVEGDRVIWSAQVGTGTGARLAGGDGTWEFSTPRGRFQVMFKEENPVWILPDWVFVERGEPTPPPGSPERRVEGALGDAALYLGGEIAIHGTDQPELLGQDVSHGCIRISNEDVRRLYQELEVGTPVVIY